jgi:YD repeat-containing protein
VRIVLLVVALALAALPPPGPALGAGRRVPAAAAGHAVPAHASARGPRAAGRARARHRAPLPRDARALRRAKAAAAHRYRRLLGRSRLPRAPQIRQRPSVFGGLSWTGVSASASTPPDATGAIGPSHYVEATNDGVAVYTRASAPVTSTTLDAFLGVPGDDVTDPQILFDANAGRWFFAGIDAGTGTEQLLFGWSKTADPSDLAAGWCRYSIATAPFLEDFPKLGHAGTHVVIGANRFQGNAFRTAVVYAIDKPGAGATCPSLPAFKRFGSSAAPLKQSDGQFTFTPVPANTTDASSLAYVLAADAPGGGTADQVEAWHVSGPAGNASLTVDGAIAVTPFAIPANAPQAGTTFVLDTSDARLTQAVARTDPAAGAEAVWTQHSVDGPGGRSVVRWYELLPAQLAARQTGTVAEAPDFAFNGAISPTGDGANAVIDYNASGPASAPRIAARSRRAAAPAGVTSSAVTLATSAGPLQDGSCSPCRWGDYASAVPDPLDSTVVWGSNQFVAGGDWTTRNFALSVGGDPPVASFSASPGATDTGQAVSFDGSASAAPGGASIARYQWDLDGDGSFETDTGTDPHASQTYATPGSVTVRLRVTDTIGDQSDVEQTVIVRNRPPVAVLTVSPARVLVGQTAFLDAGASFDPDGRVTRYQWDLNGDGTFETDTGARTGTLSLPVSTPRTMTLRLRVTDDTGATADAAAPLSVVRAGPAPPTAECLAAKARVNKLAPAVRKLKKQVKAARGARKRRLSRKLRTTRAQLDRARVRVRTIC